MQIIRNILFFFVLISTCLSMEAQSLDEIDSLKKSMNNHHSDSTICRELYQISRLYYLLDQTDSSILYGEKLLKLAESGNHNFYLGKGHFLMGYNFEVKGKKELTLDHYLKALKVFEKINDQEQIANCYLNIGSYYYGISVTEKAVETYKKALKIYEAINDPEGQAYAYSNIGAAFQNSGDYENARLYLKSALKIQVDAGLSKSDIAETGINIGNTYLIQNRYDEALKEFIRSLEVLRGTDNSKSIAICLINLGVINNRLNNQQKAKEYYEEAISLLKDLNDMDLLSTAYFNYAICLSALKEYDLATEMFQLKIALDDSLNNKYMMDQMAAMSETFEADKRQQEIKLLTEEKKNDELEKEKQRAELAKSNTIIYFSVGGLVLLIAFVGMLFNRNRLKSKVNKQLTEQKEQILLSKQIIELKNKEVLDSILYAKKIQDAILHEENKALKHLPEHFVLFKPKDIVSGDFYWTLQKNNCWYAAVADCTGHGVPGAFMSMLGIAFLNEITKSDVMKSPAIILNELREKVIRELGQSGSIGENRDGMDITLIKYDTETKSLEFSGAHNSLLIVRNSDLIQLQADKQPIGYQVMQKSFTNSSFRVREGDTLYLLSDGYADQFGGEKKKNGAGKKFKMVRFKEMILQLANQKLAAQKDFMEETFVNWKGDNEQIDDVCVMGIRL